MPWCKPSWKKARCQAKFSSSAGAAEIWKALEACGLPDILGVWNHEGAPATRFTAIQIRQRYPGHARKIMNAFWGLGQLMFSKVIVVVDKVVSDVADVRSG